MRLMRLLLCAVLLAGVADASIPIREIDRDAGDEYTFTVAAVAQTIASCHLTDPDGVKMTFLFNEPSQYDRFELQPVTSTTMPSCMVTLRNLQEKDSGLWEVAFVSTSGTSGSEIFQLNVTGTVPQDPSEKDDDVMWLETIEFPSRIDQIIDISLPKSEYEEKCTVRSPDGYDLRVSELVIEGVNQHESSHFVSCRITIGPMKESLLGKWALCGTHTDNGKEQVRCQPASIYWNDKNRPGSLWDTRIPVKAEHPVHFGKTLTPVVIGIGDTVTCHVVTPNGEDLVIREDSEYPGIQLVTSADSICSIAIGPIDESMLREWTVYGLFRSIFMGLNEVHLPLKMFLYDEDNPYNQAHNVTRPDPVQRIVNLGNTLNLEVKTNAGEVNSCYFETPSGQIYDLENHESFKGASFVIEDSSLACRLTIGPITVDLLGNWTVTGKFRNNNLFSEIQQTFHVFEEDPENPIEEDRVITYLARQTVDTEIGNKHRMVILHSDFFTQPESCHIRTPDGLQYKLMEGFNVNGIEVIEDPEVECGVIVNVVSEDVVGDWTLIARATRLSEQIERRLPFTIYVEESAEALLNEITITEGDDLIVRLKNPTDHYETCRLIGPYGQEYQKAEADPNHVETCGFIRRDAQTFNTGTWTITFGNRIVYKAEILVTVNAAPPAMATLDLIRDGPVEKAVGPENAVYCRLKDPQGFVIFEDFGRCILSLSKVEMEHQGIWTMLVGEPDRVVTEEYQLYVNVKESEGKAVVTTHVEQQKPIVIVACSVETKAEVKACKFRDPQGRILLATSGVSEDRYEFYGAGTSGDKHECGFSITEPHVSDLGLWRCAIETADDTYYGHLPVLCPWALSDPEIAATVQQEPALKTDRSMVSVVEDEPAVMSCSVQSAIRYCYFRASNGTIFTVSPGMSSSAMEYVGAGFDAGECGVRFHGLRHTDGGRWSCHVGLVGDHEEQRDQFQLTVHERMSVNHFVNHANVMTVEGVVYEGRALEYCRFVRIDGFGFTTDNVPSEYTVTGILSNGECQVTARNPTTLDLHPWTVVAKIRGQDVEIAKDTMESILISPPGPGDHAPPPGVLPNRGLSIFFYVFTSMVLMAVILGVCLGPKTNREWTHHRASAFRRSWSNSFMKKPAAPTNNNV